MSDNWIIFAPNDASWVPANDSVVAGARQILEVTFPVSDGIEANTFSYCNFVWNGQNFDGVFCSACNTPIDDWWAELIPHHDDRENLVDINIVTPCCGFATTLNELEYPSPVAFSRFELSIENPDDPATPGVSGVGELPNGLLEQLEAQLGTKLIVIRRHL